MRPEDLEGIIKIENAVQLHPWPKASFEQALRLKQFCVVVEDEGVITGYGVGLAGHGRTIAALTTPSANALYAAWEDEARHAGAPFMWAETELENAAARARLVRFGFQVTGTRPHFYGAGKDALVWQKPLEKNAAKQDAESA